MLSVVGKLNLQDRECGSFCRCPPCCQNKRNKVCILCLIVKMQIMSLHLTADFSSRSATLNTIVDQTRAQEVSTGPTDSNALGASTMPPLDMTKVVANITMKQYAIIRMELGMHGSSSLAAIESNLTRFGTGNFRNNIQTWANIFAKHGVTGYEKSASSAPIIHRPPARIGRSFPAEKSVTSGLPPGDGLRSGVLTGDSQPSSAAAMTSAEPPKPETPASSANEADATQKSETQTPAPEATGLLSAEETASVETPTLSLERTTTATTTTNIFSMIWAAVMELLSRIFDRNDDDDFADNFPELDWSNDDINFDETTIDASDDEATAIEGDHAKDSEEPAEDEMEEFIRDFL